MEVLPCPVYVDFSSLGGCGQAVGPDGAESAAARDALSRRLEAELRAARGGGAAGGIALPPALLLTAAEHVLQMATTEPYGLRGCTLYVDLETGKQPAERIRLATVKCAPDTLTTFELFLTLRQETSWKAALPQFLKNLTSSGALLLSNDFTLKKKRLFRTYAE
ncbi:protein charybde-like [Schistocerca serialis cubense]|uniref:protein charybde-like n=1 Tax=Schistocerca serialis cubense TaxID=2023355 RepID=UPI00214E9E3D|nr:protein charybde-like [Schistocerca serialis cubense]